MEAPDFYDVINEIDSFLIKKKNISGKETWEIVKRRRAVSKKGITKRMVERVRVVSKKGITTIRMAEAEVLRVIKEMDTFLIENKNIIEVYAWGPLNRVRNKLTLMLEFLTDKKLEEGSRLKHWIFDVVEIAHDVLFIINYANLIIQNGEAYEYVSYLIETSLEPIHKALSETPKHIHQLGVEGTNTPPITCSSQREGNENVIGFKQEVKFVLRELIPYWSTNLKIVCIVGMTGIGKTALARKVYNHPTNIERYELRVWVSVSSEMSNKEVLMNLLLQLLHNEDQSVLLEAMANADNQSLQDMIHQHLQGKRCLIVLDNISKIPYFTSIIKALPRATGRNRECTLLLTSRFKSMKHRAKLISLLDTPTLEMKPLDDDQSWQFFLNLLRFDNQKFPKQLERKGKEMLRKCGGLPLSIKEVVTQFVIRRQGGSEWEELLESPDLSGSKIGNIWPSEAIPNLHSFLIKKKNINGKETWEMFKRGRAVSKKGITTRSMAEAEVLRVIAEMCSFLIEKENIIPSDNWETVEGISNKLTLMLEFLAHKKLGEEGSRLKHWIYDLVEIAHDTLLTINCANLLIQNGENYTSLPFLFMMYLKHFHKALSETPKHIHQLGVEGANTLAITWKGDENVIGFEQEVEFVLHKVGIVCIVGMAGIGKTSLARKVYNHPTSIERYELRVWVSVSREMSNNEVLMNLILQLLHSEDQSVLLEAMANADNQSLQDMIHQQLQGKRYLIVLDNISKIPYFTSICKAFPRATGNGECTLLLTSRFKSMKHRAGKVYSPDIHYLVMKSLDDDQSWQLFSGLLVLDKQKFPKQLERKAREMLRKCDGLPLSIKEVVTQFVIKRQGGSEWEELLESPDLSRTFFVLRSIYDRWPPQVKLQFLCLSFFNKGTPIRIEKFEQVWIASQVIQENEDEDEDYYYIQIDHPYLCFIKGYKSTLTRLIEEFIIEVDTRMNGCMKCIRVNASFHTLSMAKAKEEMVLKILKKGEVCPPSSKKPRHCAIECSRDEFNNFTDHDKCLVSIFFRGGGYFDASKSYWKRFKQLRTLDFEGFGLKMLPETIGALTELRYLGLRDNYIQELPQSLGHQKNLETLDIALNFMVEVPDVVWEIGSLCYLYMSDIICRKSLKIDRLKKLKTLTYISVNDWMYEVSNMKMMTSLCKLGIKDVDESLVAGELFASLADLKNLECLILRGFRFRSLPSLHGLETLDHLTEIRLDGLITKLPSADVFPPRLTQLSLINSCLDEDPMPELGKLEDLVSLKLKNAYTGQQMVITKVGFLSLEVLCFEELWHLRNIKVQTVNFHTMKLKITNCPLLEDIPKNLTHSRFTKEVKILTTRKLADKIRKSDFISRRIEDVDIRPKT